MRVRLRREQREDETMMWECCEEAKRQGMFLAMMTSTVVLPLKFPRLKADILDQCAYCGVVFKGGDFSYAKT